MDSDTIIWSVLIFLNDPITRSLIGTFGIALLMAALVKQYLERKQDWPLVKDAYYDNTKKGYAWEHFALTINLFRYRVMVGVFGRKIQVQEFEESQVNYKIHPDSISQFYKVRHWLGSWIENQVENVVYDRKTIKRAIKEMRKKVRRGDPLIRADLLEKET